MILSPANWSTINCLFVSSCGIMPKKQLLIFSGLLGWLSNASGRKKWAHPNNMLIGFIWINKFNQCWLVPFIASHSTPCVQAGSDYIIPWGFHPSDRLQVKTTRPTQITFWISSLYSICKSTCCRKRTRTWLIFERSSYPNRLTVCLTIAWNT